MDNSPNNSQNNSIDEKVLLKKIEKEGEELLEKLKSTGKVNGDSLLNLMKIGEKEFIEKTGRRMTYSEMRQAYG
jgi:predicted nucleic-acid-binding Zn-ribbon protein